MKQKLSKKEKALAKAKKIYEEFRDEYKLEGDEDMQLSQIISKACDIKEEMEDKQKTLVEGGYEDISNLIEIDKKTWNEFVSLVVKKQNGKLNDKALDKFEQSCQDSKYIAELRQSFYDSYLCGDNMELFDDEVQDTENIQTTDNSEIMEVFNKYAGIKDYITNVLKNNYKTLYNFAYYLTNGEMTYKQFNDLVTWEFTKDSINPDKPSKSLKIYREFIRMAALMNKYGYLKHFKELSNNFDISLLDNSSEITINLNKLLIEDTDNLDE